MGSKLAKEFDLLVQYSLMTSKFIEDEFEQKINSVDVVHRHVEKTKNDIKYLKMQLKENQSVLKEINILNNETKIFKLVGPILFRQDSVEVLSDINKRIEYIKADLERLEADKKKLEKK